MVFNSLHFVAFFAVVYPLYRVLPHRAQNWMLLAASYYFYAAWDWRFLGLLIGSTVVDFCVARYLDADGRRSGRRRVRARAQPGVQPRHARVLQVLQLLRREPRRAARRSSAGTPTSITLNVILPMGISFYTFMTVSYVIDVYRREIPAERNLIDFALFVAYFPHLVAGPDPARVAAPAADRAARGRSRASRSLDGLWLVGWGCFQKMFVADNLAPHLSTRCSARCLGRGG